MAEDMKNKKAHGNTGRKHSEESKKNMSLSHLGKKFSEETRKKMSESHKANGTGKWMLGRKLSDETKKKLSNTTKGSKNHFYGKKHTDECKKRMSKNKIGVNVGKDHYNWKGGLSKNKYPIEFNRSLKMKIRERDNFTCQLCGKTEEEELKELGRVLCVNHIDFNKNNLSLNNLNTLCLRCNVTINYNRNKYLNYFQGEMNYV